MTRWLVWGIATVLAVLLLVTGTTAWLVTTDSGTRWLLQSLVPAIEDRVEINGVSGSLVSPLSIDSIHFKDCRLGAALHSVDLDWDPTQLLEKTAYVSHFSVHSVDIDILDRCEVKGQEAETLLAIPESIDLPLDFDIRTAAMDRISIDNGESTFEIDDVRLVASVRDSALQLALQNLDYSTLNLVMDINTQLQQPYQMDGETVWAWTTPESREYSGRLELQGNLSSLELVHELIRPYAVESRVSVLGLLKNPGNPHIDASNTWEQIIVPLDPDSELVIRAGSLDARGTPDQLAIVLETTLDSELAQGISVSANAKVTETAAVLEPLTVRHQDMKLDASGSVTFEAPLAVKLDLAGQGLNPGILVPDYPGGLDTEAHLEYSRQEGTGGKPARHILDLEIKHLSGQLRGFAVQGSGQVNSDLDTVHLENISLSVGDNHINVDGEISESIRLDAAINAPSLDQVTESLNGDLSGAVEVSGSLENPSVNASLESTRLGYLDDLQVLNTSMVVAMESAGDQAVDARFDIDQVRIGEESFDSLSVNISGTRPNHRIEAEARSSYGSVSLQASGGYQSEPVEWRGKISTLLLDKTLLGDWKLTRESVIAAGTTRQQVEDFCLGQQRQMLCLDYSSVDGEFQTVNASIENFDLGIAEQLLGNVIRIAGELDASAALKAGTEGDWQGNAGFAARALTLAPSDSSEIDDSLEFTRLAGSLDLGQESSIEIFFDSNRGNGSGDLKVSALQNMEQAEILGGNIILDIPDLKFLNPYISGAKIGDGSMALDFDLQGPLKSPDFTGTGRVDSLAIAIAELGLEYEDASVVVTASDLSRVAIDSQFEAGDGDLELDGSLEINDAGEILYQFDISGENFPVMNTLSVQATVTPDIEIAGSQGKIQIDGQVVIPSLNVVLQQLPAGVASVSSDEVIINSTEEVPVTETLNLLGNIDVSIGENAHFNGYGLDADLAGEMSIRLQENRAPVGNGILIMENAVYSALGQILNISKGNIIFSGPLDDPLLDILIERSDNDTAVELIISGKADNPETRLTSRPEMSEANKLSYLITGKKIDELRTGEGANLAGAAITLGLSRNSSVIQELGTSLGFDTVSLGGEGGLESTSLLLGKHLSPNLYVSYAKDLFSDLSAFQLNYQLTKSLSLEAESGSKQEVDLIYSIKR